MKGWVYIISNASLPDLVKVGHTHKDPELRAKQLSSSGVPHPYEVEYQVLVENPRRLEMRVHQRLVAVRERKEWFRCSVAHAMKVIDDVTSRYRVRGLSSFPSAGEVPHSDLDKTDDFARPLGTYTGNCRGCGHTFTATLFPDEAQVRCPECFVLTNAKEFRPQYLYL